MLMSLSHEKYLMHDERLFGGQSGCLRIMLQLSLRLCRSMMQRLSAFKGGEFPAGGKKPGSLLTALAASYCNGELRNRR